MPQTIEADHDVADGGVPAQRAAPAPLPAVQDTGDFQRHGRALLGNGYLIVPIRPGHKAPALGNWQNARLAASDVSSYPGCGVGILCGQGAQPVVAIDVDTTDADLAARFAGWCGQNLGVTVERVGNAPKILLVYRANTEGWGKSTGAWFEDLAGERHRLEILGKGQQFVAYHVHPDTGRPYEWIDFFGGLDAMSASDLPVITREQVEEALRVFEQMAVDAGLARVTGSTSRPTVVTADPDADALMALEPPVGIPLDEARAKLAYVDNEDYDTWLKVGMSLHHEFGGNPDALALWNEWSATADNYTGTDDLARRWEDFGTAGHRPVTARWLLKVGNAGEREAVKVVKRAALVDAKAIIRDCADSIDLLGDVARRVGLAAGNDIALRTELVGLIRARYKDLTGGIVLPVADARAAMGDGQPVVLFNQRRRPMTEFGNAERMLDHYGDGLMYVPEIDAWYSWTGVYWRRVAAVALEHLAKETVRALLDEAQAIESDDERAAFLKHCAMSQRAVMVRNMVSLAQSDPRVVVGVSDLDATPHLLGVGNGVVDLRSGDLLPPDPIHRITVTTASEYDPGAVCPLFEQTVADVFFGDAGMMGFFQRLIGYALLAQPREDVLAIPYGSGSNGKSTVLGAIRDVLGGYAKTAGADTFLSSGTGGGNAGGPREDILRLRGARFVYVSEPDAGSVLREGLVKSMTGGEPLPARGIHSKATVEVAPTWVAFMPTNHLPTVPSDDHAIWRRLMPVPFTRNFDQDATVTKDPGRAEKLAAEAPGILAWCVRGALDYQRDGLRPPPAVRQARESYKGDMDVLAEWLEACCEVGPEYVESNTRLWASWDFWARGAGMSRMVPNSKTLGRRLITRGFAPVRDVCGLRGRGLQGVRVRPVEGFE